MCLQPVCQQLADRLLFAEQIVMRFLIFLLGVSLTFSCHAQEPLSPAERMQIAHQVGMQMLHAGFDRAQNVRSVSDSSDAYDPSSDTVKLDPAYDEYPESGVSLRDRVASIAAHEHCHAYLIKHRHQLPKVVREAADACQIFPEAFGGRMFDEVFCDLAAINVIGKPAETLFNTMRADSDSGDASDVRRYMHHSYPVLKLALAANNLHDRNLVRRTAYAMHAACLKPEVQKFSGNQEKILSERLGKKLAEYLYLPNGDAPLVTMLPYKKLPGAVRTKMDQMRREVGEAPLQGFLAVHAACQNVIEAGLISPSTYGAGAMEHCNLSRNGFNAAYCASIAAEVTSQVVPRGQNGDEVLAKVAAWKFGEHSLPAKLVHDQIKFNLPIYAKAVFGDPQDISHWIEFSCGRSKQIVLCETSDCR